MRTVTTILLFVILVLPASAQLFVGIETSPEQPMHFSDLSGFPNVTWTASHTLDVSGAAAKPDGTLYVCNGAFNTDLYEISPGGNPVYLSTLDEDMAGLAFGRDNLYGYSNYADPKGIYQIDPNTGAATLVLDVYTGTGFRFFALDYNVVDDLFYGYTEYGDSGLYSINIDTGAMVKIVDTIPASNAQGRGLAVGNNTVYLTATRGDDGIPFFAYDLSQGVGGNWVGFNNAYPNHHSTGGAAWVPEPEPLMADIHTIPENTGGTITFSLDAGTTHRMRTYAVLCSATGTSPGTLLPGGLVTLPLNWDPLTDLVLSLANTSIFTNFFGTLDNSGQATAYLNAPPLPGHAGVVMYYAYCLYKPFDFASNPVQIEIVP